MSTSIRGICSICKQIISEPHQVSCCGAVSCRECIVSQREAEKPCWSCKKGDYESFPDLRFNKEIVKCAKAYKGCQWTGEFGKMKKHLNPEPAVGRQLEGCQFYKVRCLHCHVLVRRTRVKEHQTKDCLKKPFTCEYCKEHTAAYEDVKYSHQAKCGQVQISCPKGCGQKILRKDACTHPCPEDIIDCKFKFAGCQVRVLRKKMESHLIKEYYTHDSLCKRHEADKMQGNVALFQSLLGQVRNEVGALRGSPPACPVKLTLSNFSRYEQGNEDWYSMPFCTDFHGYTMCLKVSFCHRQIGDGGYIMLELYLMKGSNDDRLQWPLKAIFEVQLLKWGAKEGHHTTTISFNDATPQECSLQVEDTERAAEGVKCKNFIALDQLKTVYLKDNKCCFRISIKDILNTVL